MPDRILIIDDDRALAAMLVEYLAPFGYRVSAADSAESGLALLSKQRFDALILDVMLPDVDGFEVARRIRGGQAGAADIPILMLTARGDETDRIVGLELGTDDYLPKPFNPRELLARLRAVLRRHSPGAQRAAPLRFGRLEIDREARSVRVDGEARELTSHQFDLLWQLATHAGRIMSREALMERVKGEALEAFDRSIDVHVSRIRAAIEDDPKAPRRIITVRGAGYVFARLQDD